MKKRPKRLANPTLGLVVYEIDKKKQHFFYERYNAKGERIYRRIRYAD
jgi:hypothetical protein